MHLKYKPMLTYISLGIYYTLGIVSSENSLTNTQASTVSFARSMCYDFFLPWSVTSIIGTVSTVI